MRSRIAELIYLANSPVALILSDSKPEDCIEFNEGTWNCVVSMINAAATKEKTAALSESTVGCPGGKAGTGFVPLKPGVIEYFLSNGEKGPKEGEFYKKTPELAREYIESMPEIDSSKYLVFKPFEMVNEDDNIQAVVFLVDADRLSALVTLANYDRGSKSSVQLNFGSGCAQSILIPVYNEQNNIDTCTIGLTDPSARKVVDKDLLSFAIPYHRFLQLEEMADESFLTKSTWKKISERLI